LQTFETGTSFQTDFQVNKYSTNSSFFFFNPYLFSNWKFQITQPLLRNFGLFANRALSSAKFQLDTREASAERRRLAVLWLVAQPHVLPAQFETQ